MLRRMVGKTRYFWYLNGFDLKESTKFGNRFYPYYYLPNEVERIKFYIPLTVEIINIFNRFHLRYPIECWENYEEISDINEKMKELF